MPSRPSRNSRTGFTLIELMVCIASLAIMAAMSAPALRNARHSARITLCDANLRSLGSALQLYMNDRTRGIFPAWASPRVPSRNAAMAPPLALREYLGDEAPSDRVPPCFVCPADSSAVSTLGVSYEFFPGRFMIDPLRLLPPTRLAAGVTLAYEDQSSKYFDLLWADYNLDAHRELAPPSFMGARANYFQGRCDWAYFPRTPTD